MAYSTEAAAQHLDAICMKRLALIPARFPELVSPAGARPQQTDLAVEIVAPPAAYVSIVDRSSNGARTVEPMAFANR